MVKRFEAKEENGIAFAKKEDYGYHGYYTLKDSVVHLPPVADVGKQVFFISHEFMHYWLHREIGIEACILYDNIAHRHNNLEKFLFPEILKGWSFTDNDRVEKMLEKMLEMKI